MELLIQIQIQVKKGAKSLLFVTSCNYRGGLVFAVEQEKNSWLDNVCSLNGK